MPGSSKGFTLIELMIVVIVIGILAAIAIPNMLEFRHRAQEGSTKYNMHTLQITVEDYGVQNDGQFPSTMDATHLANILPMNFKNPYDGLNGSGTSWEDRSSFSGTASSYSGIVSYADSANSLYNVKGYGTTNPINLVLSNAP
jgi:prepilin-type N-terminal cleavage/methylation domain-containing protein